MRTLLTISLLLIVLQGFSQTNEYYHISYVNSTMPNGANIAYALPANYEMGRKYATVINFLGAGENGTGGITSGNIAKLLTYGANKFIEEGWNGAVNVGDSTVEMLYISVQLSASENTPAVTEPLLDSIANYLRDNENNPVDSNRVYISGLSQGGMVTIRLLTRNNVYQRITAALPMSAGTDASCPSTWTNAINYINQRGSALFMQGNADSRACNAEAYGVLSAEQPNKTFNIIYPGGHEGWNDYYDPDWTGAPGGGNMYRWFLRYTKKPIARVDSATKTTTGTVVTLRNKFKNWWGQNSIAWTKVSGPSASIASSTSDTTTATLSGGDGTYVFRVTATNAETGESNYEEVTVAKGEVEPEPEPEPAEYYFIKKRGRKLKIATD